MTDGVSETDRGWQNVARTIRGHIGTFRVIDGESLTPLEQAEHDAWLVAYGAVMDRLAERNADDGSAEPGTD